MIDNSDYGISKGTLIRYIEVVLEDIEYEVLKLLLYLNDMSWLNNLDIDWMKRSFEQRSLKTVESISNDLKSSTDSKLAQDAGEFLVSLSSIKATEIELKHYTLPLLELIKEQVKGNPGFDFITVNGTILMFGESKYRSKVNGFGDAISQIEKFIIEKKDLEEIAIIHDFVDKKSIENFIRNQKGYIAAFSIHTKDEKKLIKNIISNPHFKILEGYNEIIFIGVRIYG
jgi:hypothetical protein